MKTTPTVIVLLLLLGVSEVGSAQTDRTTVTTRHLAELRDIGGTQAGLSISPSGRRVVFNLRAGRSGPK